MPLSDSAEIRERIRHLFPGINIDSNALASGQRLVYFCHFLDRDGVPDAQRVWAKWGAVVLKISEDVHATVIARLEKEREILNSLDSPYYPRLLYCDVFSEDPVTELRFQHRLFITIEERIDGLPLDCCRDRFATEPAAIAFLSKLVDGLSVLWLHSQKLIHRDLKPANILIATDNSPVIIDLGIIREQGAAGVTGSHWNIGPCTPAYASSEQLKNEKRLITFKADFFSIGVIIYELLTGKNPFVDSQHDPLEVVALRALTETPPTLFELGKASKPLSDLIERMMAKEPFRRPRTVQILRNEITQLGAK